MKNVLHVIESSETGGAESVFIEIVKGIDQNKFRSFIILFSTGWLFNELSKVGIKPIVIETKSSFDVTLLRKIIVFIKTNNIDLIHSHLFGASVYSSIAARICDVPIICTLHGAVDVSDKERLKRTKFWVLKRLATKVVFVSKYLQEYFTKQGLCDIENSVVIYNGIDTSLYSSCSKAKNLEEFGLTENDIVIGAVGDIREAKGYGYFIRAAKRLNQYNSDIKFIVAGSYTTLLDVLQKQCDDLGVNEVVSFIGFRDDIPELLNSFNIYLLPSISEGFSLTTVEAMCSSKAVIATRCGGPEEIITNRYDGILIPAANESAIFDSVIELLNNKELYKFISINARDTVIEKFSIEAMIRKYSNLYEKVL